MPAASESYVQLPADSTGKKVRNVALSVLQADGTTATVLVQAVTLVDQTGAAVDAGGDGIRRLLTGILREVQNTNRLIAAATQQHYLPLQDDAADAPQ